MTTKPKKLPAHVPGKEIEIKIADLPRYLAENGLKPDGMSKGVLIVKKQEPK